MNFGHGQLRAVLRVAAMLFFLACSHFAAAESDSRLSQPQFDIIVERDVMVTMADGTKLSVDVYRPDAPGRFPVLVSHAPYQKDLDYLMPKPVPGWQSREMPEAGFFVPRGYVIVRADVRGVGKSEGTFDLLSLQQARDAYDLVEWSATQPWSTGKTSIGGGVGYYSFASWKVAELRPPHLTTMLSWDGDPDLYRNNAYRGGVFLDYIAEYYLRIAGFQHMGDNPDYNPQGFAHNVIYDVIKHPLYDEYWEERAADLSKIDIPVFMTDSWGVMQVHGRHNIEAYMRLSELGRNDNIKLRVHDNRNPVQYPDCEFGKHTCAFFSDEGQLDQLRWYDHWLKGIDTGIMDEPPVKIWVRRGATGGEYRFENEWPLARTTWTRLYLDANAVAVAGAVNSGSLAAVEPDGAQQTVYAAGPEAYQHRMIDGRPVNSFMSAPFDSGTEISGPVKLKLWVETDTYDMDVFASIYDVAPDGSMFHLADGWLKASHRKTDPELSRTYRPWHTHDERQLLSPNEVVEVDVEVWPISQVFEEGHRLRLDIAPYGPGFFRHGRYNPGATNAIHSGAERASYLLLPIVE